MRGRWAAGITPRSFCWIIKDRLAVSERPGGYGANHRKVRRHEELLWLRAQQFDRVVSLLASSHNLHAYSELGLVWSHVPLLPGADLEETLTELYTSLSGWLRHGERLLLHQDELSDQLTGVVAGYLLFSEILEGEPKAIAVVEQILKRQMGTVGRGLVAVAAALVPSKAEDGTAAGIRPVPPQSGSRGAAAAKPAAERPPKPAAVPKPAAAPKAGPAPKPPAAAERPPKPAAAPKAGPAPKPPAAAERPAKPAAVPKPPAAAPKAGPAPKPSAAAPKPAASRASPARQPAKPARR